MSMRFFGLLDLDYFNPVARHATHWTRNALTEDHMKILQSWPLTHIEDEFTLVHGSLDQPDLFDYVQTSWEAHLSFQQLKTPVAFIGHSHVPVTFLLSDVVDYYHGRARSSSTRSTSDRECGECGAAERRKPRFFRGDL